MVKIAPEKYEGTLLLKAKDLKELRNESTIEELTINKLANTGDTFLLKLREYENPLPLNKTNLKKLVMMYGDESDKWKNKKIILKKVLVNNPRTNLEVEGIRIE